MTLLPDPTIRFWQRVGIVFGALAAVLTCLTVLFGLIAAATGLALRPVNEKVVVESRRRYEADSVIVLQLSTIARAMGEDNKGRRELLLEQATAFKPAPPERVDK